jgi:hypothetical protein
MRRPLAAVIVLLLTSQLEGCQRGLDLEISGAPLEPDFVLRGYDGPFGRGPQPGIDQIEVQQVSGQAHKVWSMSRDPSCTPTYQLRYGVIPTGWTAWTTAEHLNPAETYVVSVSGCGFVGGRAFKILRGSIVSRDGSGDEPIREVEALR